MLEFFYFCFLLINTLEVCFGYLNFKMSLISLTSSSFSKDIYFFFVLYSFFEFSRVSFFFILSLVYVFYFSNFGVFIFCFFFLLMLISYLNKSLMLI